MAMNDERICRYPGRRCGSCTVTGLLVGMVMVLAACSRPVQTDPAPAEFIPDADYHVLMAEISLVRREYLAAAREFLAATGMSDDPALAQRATENALEYGLDGYAYQNAQRWIALDPESTDAHYALTVLSLRRGDREAAFDHLLAALGPPAGRSDDEYQAMAAAFSQETDVIGVTMLFARVAAQSPPSEMLNLILASAALRSGQYDLALESAWSAGVGGERAVQVEILIARSMLAAGDTQTALDLMAELAERNPVLPVRLEYVRLLATAGRADFAGIELERLARMFRGRSEVVLTRALINLNSGELVAARRDFSALLKAGHNIYECLYYLGQIEVENGNDKEAIRYFSRVGAGVYLLPALVQVALAESRLGDTQAGLLRLDQFSKDHPRLAFNLLETRGQLLLMAERYEEALQAYDDALVYKPYSLSTRISKATALEYAGRLDEAIALLRDTRAIAPANGIVLNALGYVLTNRTRRHRDAYRYIRTAYELAPYNPAIMDSMAWVLFKRGEPERSRFLLEQAFLLLPDPEIAAHLGEVMWSLGEHDAAREIWAQSLQTNPDSRPLKQTMGRYVN